jgi:2-aminoethylphosphonate-pyruvate transaminase
MISSRNMHSTNHLPLAHDKLLFTPGPLTTSLSVKRAMLHDAGSWHSDFNQLVASIRSRLLSLAGVSRAAGWEVVPLQGSGTFGVEAVFQTCVPPNGNVAVLANGAYGERIVLMLQRAKINHTVLRTPENIVVDAGALNELLATDPKITHVAVVHCETTTGILNPIKTIGQIAHNHGKVYVVDAMSSFAGIPIDFEECGVDFLISSSNKCIEGVPGFSFVFCKRGALLACEGWPRNLSMDLLDQFKGFEKDGKFRYTPPTHSILAFDQALKELDSEGGISARNHRYSRNHATLQSGMQRLGFRPYLDAVIQSPIITAYHYPSADWFHFETMYQKLSDRGFIIYPGKLTLADTFRIGSIGRLFPPDFEQLVGTIEIVMQEMSGLPIASSMSVDDTARLNGTHNERLPV